MRMDQSKIILCATRYKDNNMITCVISLQWTTNKIHVFTVWKHWSFMISISMQFKKVKFDKKKLKRQKARLKISKSKIYKFSQYLKSTLSGKWPSCWFFAKTFILFLESQSFKLFYTMLTLGWIEPFVELSLMS
jgi:hypothetical protein